MKELNQPIDKLYIFFEEIPIGLLMTMIKLLVVNNSEEDNKIKKDRDIYYKLGKKMGWIK
jgi:hypothetical protein